MPRIKQTANQVYDWLERRLQVEGPIKEAVLHKVCLLYTSRCV